MPPTRRRPTYVDATRNRGGAGRRIAKAAAIGVVGYVALKVALVAVAVAMGLVSIIIGVTLVGLVLAAAVVLAIGRRRP